jgi:formylglycine-generating enzyme required for sulfatase activity
MTMLTLLLCATLAADPAADAAAQHTALLKTFREEFIAITPGKNGMAAEFRMGRDEGGEAAERPARAVKLTGDFAIARYEVPQNLWEAVMGGNPSKWKGPRNSVEMLSFDDAQEFCRKATAAMREAKLIAADEVIRLPSEAEWEYCARAGTTTVYSFGDDVSALGDFAWFTGNAAGNDPPVGAKKPNAWKLYDVHGYLWEWCADEWHDDYAKAPADGSARTGGAKDKRVLRSGSWRDGPEKLTSSYRRAGETKLKADDVGLRCVLAKEPAKAQAAK